MSLSERIKAAREKAKIDQGDLAKRLSIAAPTLSKYENGHRVPDADLLEKFVRIVGCDPGWLLTGIGSEPTGTGTGSLAEARAEYGNEFVYIPQVAGNISAGGGLVPDNTVELKIAFRKDWIERRGDPKNMSLIRVSGDSMEPTLQSGDLALVDHGRNYVDPQGGIYAISIDHTIMIKRIQVMHPAMRLKVISDNNKYESIETDPDLLRINGKVIWFGREIER